MKDRSAASSDYVEAAVDRALTGDAVDQELPAALREKLISDGAAFVARQRAGAERSDRARVAWWARPALGWGVACACLLMLVLAPWRSQIGLEPGLQPGQSVALLDEALGERAGTVELNWKGLGDPAFENVSGYVRWDAQAQEGVMRLAGLPANDPTQAQYQLWIVDPARDANPVDGGVFDLSAGDNLVAIDAKLDILEAKAFAITLEQPGGVVVSDGPLLVIASG